MIFGIGTDVVEIKRIKNSYSDRFIERILTVKEREILNSFKSDKRKCEFLAGRFALKEAISKALGTGIGKVSFLDLEFLRDQLGKPVCVYQEFKVSASLSHTDEYAVAFVLLEKNDD